MREIKPVLTPEEAELAIDALVEAGRNCDRAVGGESKSGAAFRAVAAKIREARK